MSEINHLLKILILGDSSVGKTCMLLKYCDDKFVETHMPTIGNSSTPTPALSFRDLSF